MSVLAARKPPTNFPPSSSLEVLSRRSDTLPRGACAEQSPDSGHGVSLSELGDSLFCIERFSSYGAGLYHAACPTVDEETSKREATVVAGLPPQTSGHEGPRMIPADSVRSQGQRAPDDRPNARKSERTILRGVVPFRPATKKGRLGAQTSYLDCRADWLCLKRSSLTGVSWIDEPLRRCEYCNGNGNCGGPITSLTTCLLVPG